MALSRTGTGSEMSVTHLYALKNAFSAALLLLERLSTSFWNALTSGATADRTVSSLSFLNSRISSIRCLRERSLSSCLERERMINYHECHL